jgi:hypothetical protein
MVLNLSYHYLVRSLFLTIQPELYKYNMDNKDIIRAVLELLDTPQEPEVIVPDEPGEKPSRFRQILDMLDNRDEGEYANSPNEIVADVDAVTTLAGGGINGPKHPADIRVKDPRGYE